MADKSYLSQLQKAEGLATEIIRKAQESRDRRLNQAKFDAQQELGKTKADLDREYHEAAEKDTKGSDPELLKMQENYRKKAAEVSHSFNQYKDNAIEFLVESVFRVNLEVPKVVIGKFD
jgi:ATP synthase subunit G